MSLLIYCLSAVQARLANQECPIIFYSQGANIYLTVEKRVHDLRVLKSYHYHFWTLRS